MSNPTTNSTITQACVTAVKDIFGTSLGARVDFLEFVDKVPDDFGAGLLAIVSDPDLVDIAIGCPKDGVEIVAKRFWGVPKHETISKADIKAAMVEIADVLASHAQLQCKALSKMYLDGTPIVQEVGYLNNVSATLARVKVDNVPVILAVYSQSADVEVAQ